jgi:HD-GYP domain-containing protein (c-di-GMP phosphodiesterase class II)
MLRQIPVAELRVGMYIHSLDGPWIAHPFWKTRFVLQDLGDLRALQASAVATVWIDVAKSAHPLEAPECAPAPPAESALVGAALEAVEASPRGRRAKPLCRAQDEMARASQVLNRSKQAVMALYGDARLGRAVQAASCAATVEDITRSVSRSAGALISLGRLKSIDEYTYLHAVTVCALMVALAKQLGLDDDLTREAGMAGLLHDVGKVGIPEAILNKPGKLTDAEFALMRSHPEVGHRLLSGHPGFSPHSLDTTLHHHEKFDGSGYPHGLKAESIGLLARMCAVCDVYDAVTSQRCYKSAWPAADALGEMAKWSGHFDRDVFRAFLSCIGIYPIGTLVRLESGRLAVVLDQGSAGLLKPVVRVFFSTRSRMPIPLQVLDLSALDCTERIVGTESVETWGFTQLNRVWMEA